MARLSRNFAHFEFLGFCAPVAFQTNETFSNNIKKAITNEQRARKHQATKTRPRRPID
jgi:hypothetical protein